MDEKNLFGGTFLTKTNGYTLHRALGSLVVWQWKSKKIHRKTGQFIKRVGQRVATVALSEKTGSFSSEILTVQKREE